MHPSCPGVSASFFSQRTEPTCTQTVVVDTVIPAGQFSGEGGWLRVDHGGGDSVGGERELGHQGEKCPPPSVDDFGGVVNPKMVEDLSPVGHLPYLAAAFLNLVSLEGMDTAIFCSLRVGCWKGVMKV